MSATSDWRVTSATETTITVSWQNSSLTFDPDCVQVRIEWFTDASGQRFSHVANLYDRNDSSGNELPPNYTITGLQSGTYYYLLGIELYVRDSSLGPPEFIGSSPGFNGSTTGNSAAPTNFSNSSITDTSIRLTWSATSSTDSYSLYISTAQNSFSTTADFTTNYLFYLWTDLLPNTHYYFKIIATNGTSSSNPAYSDFTTRPSNPTSFQISAATSASLTLSWDSATSLPNSFNLYISTAAGSFDTTPNHVTSDGTATSHTFTTLSPNIHYYFQIIAQSASITSDPVAADGYTLSIATNSIRAFAEGSDSIRVVWEWAGSTKPQSIQVDYGTVAGVYTTATTTVQISNFGSDLYTTTALQSIQPGTLIYVQVTTTPNGIEGTSAAYLAQNYTSYLATNIRTTSFTIVGQVKPPTLDPSYSQIKIFCWQNFGEQQQSITIDSSYTATPINISSLTANTLYTFNFVDPDRNYLTDAVFSSFSNTWFPNFYVATGPEAPTDFTAGYGTYEAPTTIFLAWKPMGTFLKINLYISETDGVFASRDKDWIYSNFIIGETYAWTVEKGNYDLKPGTMYYFKLDASNDSGDTLLSDSVVASIRTKNFRICRKAICRCPKYSCFTTH